jgi:ribonuclease R
MTTPSFAERIRAIAAREELSDSFSAEVLREVEAWVARPEIDAPELEDWTALPFVTVDGPDTRDLDQALQLGREPGGFRLRYAIADASHYVRPGSALFAEALARGASFYLPGFTVPMLPRALSEGLVSLGPGVARRALGFDVTLDSRGGVSDWCLRRVRVRSRAKLSFAEVGELLARPSASPLAREPFAESLLLLDDVGTLRARHDDRKQMVRFRRMETGPYLDAHGTLQLRGVARDTVELANEQVSILCNALGARYLAQSEPDYVQPIYRVHSPPDPERVAGFERLVRTVAGDRGLPDDPWVYRRAAVGSDSR